MSTENSSISNLAVIKDMHAEDQMMESLVLEPAWLPSKLPSGTEIHGFYPNICLHPHQRTPPG
jgi:hypothetical protein